MRVLILVRAVSWPVLDVTALQLGLDVFRYAPLYAYCIHSTNVFCCEGKVVSMPDTMLRRVVRTCPLPPRHPAILGIYDGDDALEMSGGTRLYAVRVAFHLSMGLAPHACWLG